MASRLGPQRLCCRIRRGIFKCLQPFSVTVHSPHLPEDIHNRASSKADCYNIPEWLHTPGTDTCHHEVPGEAGPATHPGPSPICIQSKQATPTVLHTVLRRLEQHGAYARLLFVDYSSAFNTILPCRLLSNMSDLGVQHNICLWIRDFLTDRPQSVRMGPHLSSTLTLGIGAPQGCVLGPFLYSLYTHDLISSHNTNNISQICRWYDCGGADESAYRGWQSGAQRTISHSTPKKPKALIMDFRKKQDVHTEHQWGEGGEGVQLQIPGHTHLWGPHMDSEHHSAS